MTRALILVRHASCSPIAFLDYEYSCATDRPTEWERANFLRIRIDSHARSGALLGLRKCFSGVVIAYSERERDVSGGKDEKSWINKFYSSTVLYTP